MSSHRPPTSARPACRLAAGFTLVEVLVVVIIMGIAAAVIVPALGGRDDQNAAAAARAVVADLIFAQNQAITTQVTQYVTFSTSAQNYSLLSAKPSVVPTAYVTNPLTQKNYVTWFGTSGTSALQKSKIQSVGFDGQVTLAFDELGQPLSWDPASGNTASLVNAGTIVVKSGAFTLTVSVEPYSGALSVN